MTYDGENRPLSVTWNGVRIEYVYGADGTRLQQITNANTAQEEVITYLGPVEIRGNLDNPDSVLVYPHDRVRLEDGVESYLFRDQLGSLVYILDNQGNRDLLRGYQPFGENSVVGNWDPAAAEESIGFIGERYDAGAGLQYLNARYYDPELGLFLQPDWFEVSQAGVGTSRYAYSGNDPVNQLDPGGNIYGLLGKAVQLFAKGGDFGATFAGAIQDTRTVFSRNATLGQ
ncbi:RHS repeat-associated core domain-containing protein [Octadecabacter sp. CECT 8868]|uniref:RHS repeat-associated core domain-containing protein n=1 Tax=Octadecabacter algicola TaxID=2909342 RepID=UPI001F37D0B8|nr:RHS repeat-associated core domain-containing protein [Octadecabacter algicola]MCF2904996.1 RHS repeat-associated core domain-containing protein [Octadecabacter algicola]